MRAHLVVLAALTFPTAAAAGDKAAKEEVTTDLILSIDEMVYLGHWVGSVKVVHFDPRFVVSGTATWVERPDVIARGSQQAFAIHSPSQLGLIKWKPGDEICLRLTRIRDRGKTSWRMSPLKPDAGCTGGGRKR